MTKVNYEAVPIQTHTKCEHQQKTTNHSQHDVW